MSVVVENALSTFFKERGIDNPDELARETLEFLGLLHDLIMAKELYDSGSRTTFKHVPYVEEQ